MRFRIVGGLVALSLVAFVAPSCSAPKSLGFGEDIESRTFGPSDADAGEAGAAEEGDIIAYCPSDRCPAGRTTCPGSAFLCSVDLSSDPRNCGECGNRCPTNGGNEQYSCVDGRCAMTCNATKALDCDDVPDNGCETVLPDNDHCGACGLKCPADKPCINRSVFDFRCGCNPGELYCANRAVLPCVDAQTDDANCGACNNRCPQDGDGSQERPPHTYFGCSGGQCGALKCEVYYSDCDGKPENGCEVSVVEDDNCGGCGNQCPAGMHCRLNPEKVPECMCPQGQTYCQTGCTGSVCTGYCADLASDNNNCGGCGAPCSNNVRNAVEHCSAGACERTCTRGWGDCNGNRDDGCETDIAYDPKNCGACGNVCDGIAGQACVDGQCMVEPCDTLPDAGELAR